ncbi:hypothetical protein AC628_14560 [Bradyrhizobium sp. NAS96.2]|nr:hypothetical protein AC628_14560 [Bradyrhizobium sp. NAS96.2]
MESSCVEDLRSCNWRPIIDRERIARETMIAMRRLARSLKSMAGAGKGLMLKRACPRAAAA